MKKQQLYLPISTLMWLCNIQFSSAQEKMPELQQLKQPSVIVTNPVYPKNATITINTFNIDGCWGYEIYVDKKKYIRQEHIPTIQGMKSFITKKDAEKVANLVKSKIQSNTMPPSITTEELNDLKIKYNQ